MPELPESAAILAAAQSYAWTATVNANGALTAIRKGRTVRVNYETDGTVRHATTRTSRRAELEELAPGAIIDCLARYGEKPSRPLHFTPAELRVIDGISDGLNNAEIAGRLGLQIPTVKTHVLKMYGRLGVSNRVAVIRAAWRARLLPACPICERPRPRGDAVQVGAENGKCSL